MHDDAFDVIEDLTTLVVDSVNPRSAGEPTALEVAEERVHGRRPGACRSPNRVPHPDDEVVGVPAFEALLDHDLVVILTAVP
jgi:hypothetical protein